ncbi:MAG: hypothetical protein E7211_20230 [Clostridium lundense]|nr:hypothetical protein [Clostridium lundense]
MIILHGEDAEQFRSLIFNPTKEQINKRIQMRKELDSNITIKDTEHGYTAIISNLDLSLLDVIN